MQRPVSPDCIRHHPVFRNLDVKTRMQEGPFCGHFSRFAEADSLSLPGETVSEALPARLSPVSKIPFLAAIWQEFGRVDNLKKVGSAVAIRD
jgi:hypothetical protein